MGSLTMTALYTTAYAFSKPYSIRSLNMLAPQPVFTAPGTKTFNFHISHPDVFCEIHVSADAIVFIRHD
jgi:hypothetical protein